MDPTVKQSERILATGQLIISPQDEMCLNRKKIGELANMNLADSQVNLIQR